jgi:hypothetical protein
MGPEESIAMTELKIWMNGKLVSVPSAPGEGGVRVWQVTSR